MITLFSCLLAASSVSANPLIDCSRRSLAAAIATVEGGDGLLVQQNSVTTVFNTPQFSGAPGFSTINANNRRVGDRLVGGGPTSRPPTR